MSALRIRKSEGDFEHILVREEETRVAAHIQLPRGDAQRRVVVAMPAGKAALAFETAAPAGWTLAGEPVTFADADGQNGVRFVLATEQTEVAIPVASILLNHTLLARFGVDPDRQNENRLKDLFRSGGIRELESALGMSLQDLSDRGVIAGPARDARTGRVAFTRRSLGGRNRYRLEFAAEAGADLRVAGDCVLLARQAPSAGGPLRLAVRASTDFARLTPLPFAELVNEKGRGLAARDPHFAEAVRHFEFLSYREKFLAGSWNFLSYFGRDTLIALRIMWPVLSARAKLTGIQSVANETAANGIVNVTDEWTDDRTVADALECGFRAWDRHEPDRARQHLQAVLAGTVPEHPFLDVLDQTFMFPAAAAHWFRETDDGPLAAWLREEHAVLGRTESNLATLLRNWNYILDAAAPYAEAWRALRARHPGLAPHQIPAACPDGFKAAFPALVHSIAGAANWRDTYNLPWHFRSEDINVNLLPMALAAIQDMLARIAAAGLAQELAATAQPHALATVRGYIDEPGRFAAVREAWDWDLMREHFMVRLRLPEMRRNLARYLAGLAEGVPVWGDRDRGRREREATLRGRVGGVTVDDFLHRNRAPAAVQDGLEFPALLLDPDGRPVPVMHSDDVFFLLFGEPAPEQVRKILHLLALPYPFGLGFLDEDLGLAITNGVHAPQDLPALHDNWKNAWVKFGPDEYHGRSAWPWVLFALASGIHHQVFRGIDPAGRLRAGVANADLEQFRWILGKLKSSLAKLGPLATSEVFKYAPAQAANENWRAEPLGISTPVQLWSAAPANLLLDEALERIGRAGFR